MIEAKEEYYRLIEMGMGLPAIAKMLEIPPIVPDKRYFEGGFYTEPYVLREIAKRLEDSTQE